MSTPNIAHAGLSSTVGLTFWFCLGVAGECCPPLAVSSSSVVASESNDAIDWASESLLLSLKTFEQSCCSRDNGPALGLVSLSKLCGEVAC